MSYGHSLNLEGFEDVEDKWEGYQVIQTSIKKSKSKNYFLIELLN